MAATDTPKRGLEGTLYYNLDYDADENVSTGWVELAYATDFNLTDNSGKQVYYKKYTKMGTKRGRREITGNIGQLYTKYAGSIMKLCKDNVRIALRLDIDEDGDGTVRERLYLSTVDLDGNNFNGGNLNDASDMTIANTFTAADYHSAEV